MTKRQPAGIPTGGQFAAMGRGESEVPVSGSTAYPAGVSSIDWSLDGQGRAVAALTLDREQMDYGEWDAHTGNDWQASPQEIDTFLEAKSDDPEAFGAEIDWKGSARWDSASSRLILTAEDHRDRPDDSDASYAFEGLHQTLLEMRYADVHGAPDWH